MNLPIETLVSDLVKGFTVVFHYKCLYVDPVADLGGDPGVHGNPPFLPE